MTELQAALGLTQLDRLDSFIAKRHQIANRYNERLAGLPIITPWQHPDTYSSFHLYIIKLQLDKLSKTHKQIFAELHKEGIGVNLHYIPIHTQPYYQNLGFKLGDFPESEKYYQEAISLPMFYDLTIDLQNQVIEALIKVIK